MKRIIEILNQIFALRVEKHYYHGDKIPKNAEKVWKKAEEAFDKMNEAFELLEDSNKPISKKKYSEK